jgi:Domain of unknown function (DUF4258)
MPAFTEPLEPGAARRLLRAILAKGNVIFSSHALDEMEQDAITEADVIRVLRGGAVEPAELVRGSWRYRVRAQSLYVVATFRSEARVVVVTAWRIFR